ncbi:heat shock protein transcriptional repressor HspR [Microlunatus soli]|uniref:MerR family transcriptional regulator, heat shock protein HspR n=1 Tax=Microlunatus soli TaxID=630515 RepID=A0A1H1VIW8_9ACTN|nr:MerR family transcriptional regulator [Microlunatus soli]SDS84827.1 MerR family transcriptional regulator, heat shock protein HspR [Microlunatus soli]
MVGVPLPQPIDNDAPLFVISVAAQLAGMHPQTLRTYDRMGLVSPRRTRGRGRRYSRRDVARLRLIQRLSQDEGINLEGIRRIMAMENEIEQLRRQVNELSDLLAASRAAPPSSRVFTADPGGDVHLGRSARPGWALAPRALPGPPR